MSRRTGFVLDASSMGQSAEQQLPRSRSPSPSSSKAAPVNCASQLFMPRSELRLKRSPSATPSSCSHAEQTQSVCNASMQTISTEYFRKRMQQLRDTAGCSGDASLMNLELNSIFLKRLDEIDCLEKQQQSGDATGVTPQLRLVTFQEWVDLLLSVNNLVFGNLSALEEEAYGKIKACFQSAHGEQEQALEENRKLRKDICSIIKLVQNAYQKNCWNTDDICLETLTINQLLGVPRDQCRPESESEKMAKCMKSLVNEVAAKHDEVCQLQSQLCALDEIVQTARQKLLLKDQCIAQLNKELNEVQQCLSHAELHGMAGQPTCSMEEGDQPTEHLTKDTEKINQCLGENLVESDQLESDMLRLLNTELTELLELNHQRKVEAMDNHKKRLSCIFKKISSERSDTLRKLTYIRSQLRALDPSMEHFTPQACSSFHEANDVDKQLIEGLRRCVNSLNKANKELHCKSQRLESQYIVKYSELKTRYEMERCISRKSSNILKEIADLICSLTSKCISYEELYNETPEPNPFCAAIMDIHEKSRMPHESELKELRECHSKSDTDPDSFPTATTTQTAAGHTQHQ